MKDNELVFDRSCHVLYTKRVQKADSEENCPALPARGARRRSGTRVQRQYVDFLSDWRTDLGGKQELPQRPRAAITTALR